MTRCLVVLTVVGVGLSSLPLRGHHAISDVYDEERTVVIEGRVASFLFGNPHSMVHVRVPDGRGVLHTWAVEWRAASRLRNMGWTADALRVGDRVSVCGNPGRDPGAYRLYLLSVTRLAPGAPPDAADHLCEPAPPAMRSAGSNARLGSPRAPRR